MFIYVNWSQNYLQLAPITYRLGFAHPGPSQNWEKAKYDGWNDHGGHRETSHRRAHGDWITLHNNQTTHLLLILLQLLLPLLALALGVLELLPHLHVTQVQLGELGFLGLNVLVQFVLLPAAGTAR